MKTSTISRVGALIILIGAVSAPVGLAQVFLPDNSTWSISEPTLVGETVLQPGTYRIMVAPGSNDRHVVRIMSPDGMTHHTTVLTVPHPLKESEEMPSTMFVYYPPIEGEPRALRTWFPAEAPRGMGYDIVYDEDRAAALARASSSRVVFVGETEEADLATTELRVVTPERRIETYLVPQTRVAVVTERPTIVAESRTTLPATAGKVPLIALLGFLAIAAAAAFRIANR